MIKYKKLIVIVVIALVILGLEIYSNKVQQQREKALEAEYTIKIREFIEKYYGLIAEVSKKHAKLYKLIQDAFVQNGKIIIKTNVSFNELSDNRTVRDLCYDISNFVHFYQCRPETLKWKIVVKPINSAKVFVCETNKNFCINKKVNIVFYRIYANRDKTSVLISYSTPDGIEQHEFVTPIETGPYLFPEEFTTPTITAQAQEKWAFLTVEIWINGILVKRSFCSGSYCVASASL